MADKMSPLAVGLVITLVLVLAVPCQGQGMSGMTLLGVEGSATPPQAAAAPPAAAPAVEAPRTYDVRTEKQLDAIMSKPGYWKQYISGSESLTGAEARFHGKKAEVESWGSWAMDYAAGTVSTLASPGDIAPWTFRNVTYSEYYRAYAEYLHYMEHYGYLDPAIYKKRKAWLDKKRY